MKSTAYSFDGLTDYSEYSLSFKFLEILDFDYKGGGGRCLGDVP